MPLTAAERRQRYRDGLIYNYRRRISGERLIDIFAGVDGAAVSHCFITYEAGRSFWWEELSETEQKALTMEMESQRQSAAGDEDSEDVQ